MKVVFRVDASSTIGSGHLSRCLTLAREIARGDADVAFACRAPTEHTIRWIAREGYPVIEVKGPEEALATAGVVAGADVVVLDGYTFGADVRASIRKVGSVLCVVDDIASESIVADVVLNGNLFGDRLRYDRASRTLLGPSYALVREEFREAREARERSGPRSGPRTRRMLLSMGGADPAKATEAFLDALSERRDLAPLELKVVIGGANPRAAALVDQAGRLEGHTVDTLVDVAKMSELMTWCDVAVVAAGSTCLELACIGVPSVVVPVADNQEPVATAVETQRLMLNVGRMGPGAGHDLVACAEVLFADRTEAAAMAARQRATVDGRGAERASEALRTLVTARKV